MSKQPFYSLKNPDFCMSKRASALLDSYRNKKQCPRLSKFAGRVNHNTRQSKPDEVGKNRDAVGKCGNWLRL